MGAIVFMTFNMSNIIFIAFYPCLSLEIKKNYENNVPMLKLHTNYGFHELAVNHNTFFHK